MMEQRLLIAYALIALMVAGFAFLWLKLSRGWRHDRRAHRRGILPAAAAARSGCSRSKVDERRPPWWRRRCVHRPELLTHAASNFPPRP
jgi:hypothetical protein